MPEEELESSAAEWEDGFGPGTPLLTEYGYRPVEDISVGDKLATGEGVLRAVVETGTQTAPAVRLSTPSRPPLVLSAATIVYASTARLETQLDSPNYGKRLYGLCARIPAGDCDGRRGLVALPATFPFALPPPAFPASEEADMPLRLMRLAGWACALGMTETGDGLEIPVPCSRRDAFRYSFADFITDEEVRGGIVWTHLVAQPSGFLRTNFIRNGEQCIPAGLLALEADPRAAFRGGHFDARGEMHRGIRAWQATGVYAACDLAGLADRPAIAPGKGWQPLPETTYSIRVAKETETAYSVNTNGDTITPLAVADLGARPLHCLKLEAGHTCLAMAGLVLGCA